MVDILLAVYNGRQYLTEQIDSILSQTYHEWKLLICDDCSSDGSFETALEYAKRYPEKITAIRRESPAGSAQGNFMDMLGLSDAEYTMFCDQDDVWLPEKIKLTMNKMREMESSFGSIPLLVHTDMIVSSSDLSVISSGFMKYSGLDPSKRTINNLIVQNNISGCTMMINSALKELVCGTPPQLMVMHDWWIGLAAASFGRIGYVDAATMKYRQHGGNQVGAKHYKGFFTFVAGAAHKLMRVFTRHSTTDDIAMIQAQNFLSYYGEKLPPDVLDVVRAYCSLPGLSRFRKWRILCRYKLQKQNLPGIVSQFFS